MERSDFEGKRIKVPVDFFYTVVRVIEVSATHLVFIDKKGEQRAVRLIDIKKIL